MHIKPACVSACRSKTEKTSQSTQRKTGVRFNKTTYALAYNNIKGKKLISSETTPKRSILVAWILLLLFLDGVGLGQLVSVYPASPRLIVCLRESD